MSGPARWMMILLMVVAVAVLATVSALLLSYSIRDSESFLDFVTDFGAYYPELAPLRIPFYVALATLIPIEILALGPWAARRRLTALMLAAGPSAIQIFDVGPDGVVETGDWIFKPVEWIVMFVAFVAGIIAARFSRRGESRTTAE